MYFISLLCIFFIIGVFGEELQKYPNPRARFSLANINGAFHTSAGTLSGALFGQVRDIVVKPQENHPYKHPRVVMGEKEWESLLHRYSTGIYGSKERTWAASFFRLSKSNGPLSNHISFLADLEASGTTKLYRGMHKSDFRSDSKYEKYRYSLKKLGHNIRKGNELHSHSLFLCAFWASVSERQKSGSILKKDSMATCVNATVAWATVLLAHRTYYCNPSCRASKVDPFRSYIWNFDIFWQVKNDWHSGGLGLALAYDVIFRYFTRAQRRTIRSAIALLVLRRFTWGTTQNSTVRSPNARIHPHRVFSNWALYHSNLYLTNLAIEHEKDFDSYARNILLENNSKGFNKELDNNWDALFSAFMSHSIYPDGSSFEDGYTFHTALREGGLGIIANHRRGKGNHIDNERFRNMIHSVAQSWEPWKCGDLVGHASGGGLHYPSYVGLMLYAYPDGVLSKMLWAQRFGKEFRNTPSCRIWWTQTMTQLAFFGNEHMNISGRIIDSPSSLPQRFKNLFPLSYVTTRRGLIICRGSHSTKAPYLHVDARVDSIFLGHDNADRGSFTFSALERKWIVDLPWKDNVNSRRHSLLHVNGLSQAVKAPPATILKVHDDNTTFVAAVDLTYTYNVQWAPAWQGPNIGTGNVKEYFSNSSWVTRTYKFRDREQNTPWDLGWPLEDDARDIGFYPGMNLNPLPNIGFAGTNQWRRPYRRVFLNYYVRSAIVVRSKKGDAGYAIIVDSVDAGPGMHTFESYLILHDKVSVSKESFCTSGKCIVRLKTTGRVYLEICAVASGVLSFRHEKFGTNRQRLIFKSTKMEKENFWIAMFPHYGGRLKYSLKRKLAELEITFGGSQRYFYVEEKNHTVVSGRSRSPKNIEDIGTCSGNLSSKNLTNSSNYRNKNCLFNIEAHASPTAELIHEEYNDVPLNSISNRGECKDKDDGKFYFESLPPIEPQNLQRNREIRINYHELISIPRAAYYYCDEEDYQKVFTFNSIGGNVDIISTCSNYTNSESIVYIYNCRNINEYYDRDCEMVSRSTGSDICSDMASKFKTKLEVQLEQRTLYYVVVRILRRISSQPKISITLFP